MYANIAGAHLAHIEKFRKIQPQIKRSLDSKNYCYFLGAGKLSLVLKSYSDVLMKISLVLFIHYSSDTIDNHISHIGVFYPTDEGLPLPLFPTLLP